MSTRAVCTTIDVGVAGLYRFLELVCGRRCGFKVEEKDSPCHRFDQVAIPGSARGGLVRHRVRRAAARGLHRAVPRVAAAAAAPSRDVSLEVRDGRRRKGPSSPNTNLEANAKAFGWKDRVIKYQALQKLRNTAKTWYDSLQKNKTSWTTWKWKDWRSVLLDTFETKRNMYSMLKELMEIKPTEGQSLYEFYFQQKSRIDRMRLGFSDPDIISVIVGSIGDKNISTAADAGSFRYCDELASFLHSKIYTSVESKPSQKHNPTSSNYTKRQIFQNNSEIKTESTNQNTAANDLSKIKCFICGEAGHKKFNCKLKSSTMKCNFCQKPGHLEAACRSKSNTKVEKDSDVKLVNIINDKEKFYKDVSIDHHKFSRAFIDMGSDCSLITCDVVEKLGLPTFKLETPVHLTGFTAGSFSEVKEGVNANLTVDSVELPVTFYVINKLSGSNVLIGRNFTENNRIMYSRVGNSLVFQPAVVTEQVSLIDSSMLNTSSSEHLSALNEIFSKFPKTISNDLSTLGATSSVPVPQESVMNITEADWMLSVQLQDPKICAIKEILESGQADEHKQIFREYDLLGNKTILEALRSMGANTDYNKWDQHITSIQQGINSTINKTTSAVPSEVFFGYRLQMNSDRTMSEIEESEVDVTALRKMVDDNIKLLKFLVNQMMGKVKVASNFKGPFQVTEALGHDRYKVEDMRGADRTSRRYEDAPDTDASEDECVCRTAGCCRSQHMTALDVSKYGIPGIL
ncbi:ty3 transposon peptidase domain-containing protein [Phthorimaea operculella]|nr:ty3 transposon peptidase domain-containing protein [Phthorimaea operculella]